MLHPVYIYSPYATSQPEIDRPETEVTFDFLSNVTGKGNTEGNPISLALLT